MLTTVLLWILCSFAQPTTLDQAMVDLRTTFPEWQENYVRNEFDCSNMSALVADYLNASGLKAEIRQGMTADGKKAHAWVVCEDKIVESTQLRVTKPSNPTYAEYATPVVYPEQVMKEQYSWRNSKYIKDTIHKAKGGDDPVTLCGVSPNTVVPTPPEELVSVITYGAVGDGETDDSVAIQQAADYCMANDKTLSIPAGTYLISYAALNAEYSRKYLDLSCNVECAGKITWEVGASTATTAQVKVLWKETAVNVPVAGLGGLTKGSSQITGISGYQGGSVVLTSTEVSIIRTPGTGSYKKQEASVLTGTTGQLSKPLDFTYTDTGLLTVTVHPYEAPLTITGLSLEMTGTPAIDFDMFVSSRDNITYNDLSVVQATTATAGEAYVVYMYGCGVIMNDPIITGGSTDPETNNGYGMICNRTCGLTINRPNFTGASGHEYAGMYTKWTAINGGTINSGNQQDPSIDEHWGTNLIVDGTTIYNGVAAAGENVTIRNCTYERCTRLLLIRSDTPELLGDVLIEDCVIASKKSDQSFMYGFQYIYGYTDPTDYLRTLGSPTSVTINDVSVTEPAASDFYLFGASYNYTYTNPGHTPAIADIGSRSYSNVTYPAGTLIVGIS